MNDAAQRRPGGPNPPRRRVILRGSGDPFQFHRMPVRRALRFGGALALAAALGGCSGAQSALAPAGEDARVLARLFWIMFVGAAVLWIAVNGLFFYTSRVRRGGFDTKWTAPLIVGGGVILPLVVIVPLLTYGLAIMPDQRAPGEGLRVEVTGEQWWWRVTYHPADGGAPVVSANEIRLPAGQRTAFHLGAAEVIHSFWVPALGGKLDMFPGRETVLTLRPETPGVYRGQCAEFCGLSHAWMAFEVVVMPPEEFDAWLAAEAAEARAPQTEAARRGAAIFDAEGCGACHAVRGTPAVGEVGPDLTHVGSRLSLGAGRLNTELEDFARWIAHTGDLKPGVEMPDYDHLTPEALADLSHYLKGLE